MSDPSFIEVLGYAIPLLILLFLSAFFSASETAFISLTNFHLAKVDEKDERAHKLAFWFKNPNKVLITTLTGNNVVNICISVLAAALCYRFAKNVRISMVTGIVSFVILVFAEIIPKSLARKSPEKYAIRVATPIKIICIILTPVTKTLLFLSRTIVNIFGGEITSILPVLSEEDLKAMISAGEKKGIIEEEEREMIHSIFELGDTMIREIMTPRVNVIAVEEETPVNEILSLLAQEGCSRMPVFHNNIDTITGIVYIKDIIALQIKSPDAAEHTKAKEVMLQPYFIPDTKKVQDLMKELQQRKLQMAIVIDEYGGTAGLVTLEDLVEELVGEITDEYDAVPEDFLLLDDSTVLVSGGTSIRNVNKKLGLNLSAEEDIDTIGGYVLHLFGRIPRSGEKFLADELEFEVDEADKQHITQVRIRQIQETEDEEDAERC